MSFTHSVYESSISNQPIQANLKLWLKAGSGITKDGSDRVSQWDDQGINGNDVVQLTGSKQPLFVDTVLNSEPIVRFDGGDEMGFSPAFNANDFSIYVVMSATGGSGIDYFIGDRGDDDDGLLSDYGNDRAGGASVAGGFVRGNTGFKDTFKYGSFYKGKYFLQGAEPGTYFNQTDIAEMDISAVGNRGEGGGLFVTGDFAEIMVYDVEHGATDQATNESYLSTKYAL